MAFAIELYFDTASDSRIRAAWSELFAAGLPAWPLQIGARPHVSILVVDSASAHSIGLIFHSIGPAAPFRLIFKLADYFGVEDGVIFLKPEDSVELHNLHRQAAAEARSRGLIPRHEGDEWVPHCTCDYSLSKDQVSHGLSVLKRFLPLQVDVEEAGYVEVTPQSVRQIDTARI
jgi:hypothetical protein